MGPEGLLYMVRIFFSLCELFSRWRTSDPLFPVGLLLLWTGTSVLLESDSGVPCAHLCPHVLKASEEVATVPLGQVTRAVWKQKSLEGDRFPPTCRSWFCSATWPPDQLLLRKKGALLESCPIRSAAGGGGWGHVRQTEWSLLADSARGLTSVEVAQVSSLQLHYRCELQRPRESKEWRWRTPEGVKWWVCWARCVGTERRHRDDERRSPSAGPPTRTVHSGVCLLEATWGRLSTSFHSGSQRGGGAGGRDLGLPVRSLQAVTSSPEPLWAALPAQPHVSSRMCGDPRGGSSGDHRDLSSVARAREEFGL